MDAYVINLDRSADRLARFREINDHLGSVRRFPAIDGAAADRQSLVRDGIFEADMLDLWRVGAIGCGLSHLKLWEEVMRSGRPALICEDDAIFHARFGALSEQLIGALGSDWDVVKWGWNYNAPFGFHIPGLPTIRWIARAETVDMSLEVDEFRHYEVAPTIVRLRQSFGTVAYSVSPAGAQKLREFCLPIRRMKISGVTSTPIGNGGIDVMMNGVPEIRAFAALPPLVMARDDAPTTIS
jgi:GR25 family glycosyltransferase involved in LPS biosynthesis